MHHLVQPHRKRGRDRNPASSCCQNEKSTRKPLQEVNMPGPLSTIQITMNDPRRALLQSWLRCPTKPSGLLRRARALLLLAQGSRDAPTARQVGLSERHVRKWARRFREQGQQVCTSGLVLVGLLSLRPRSHCMWSSWLVNGLISLGVPCPSGTAPNSPATFKPMASCPAFPSKQSAESCRPTSSSLGALTCGFPQRCLGISTSPNR
jgi:hypothetical protein